MSLRTYGVARPKSCGVRAPTCDVRALYVAHGVNKTFYRTDPATNPTTMSSAQTSTVVVTERTATAASATSAQPASASMSLTAVWVLIGLFLVLVIASIWVSLKARQWYLHETEVRGRDNAGVPTERSKYGNGWLVATAILSVFFGMNILAIVWPVVVLIAIFALVSAGEIESQGRTAASVPWLYWTSLIGAGVAGAAALTVGIVASVSAAKSPPPPPPSS